MKELKKNIWGLFITIFLIITTLFVFFGYMQWKNTYKDFQTENENIAKLVANSSKTYFSQLEIVLAILGKQLSKEKDIHNAVVSNRIFSELIKMDKSIAGFGFVRPDGNYIMFSGDTKQAQMLPNLLKQEESKTSFKRALTSEHMVIGRTYYFEPLSALIIPVRKAIRNKAGNVISVITIAINVGKIEFVNTNILFTEENVIVIARNDDLYKQLIISKKFNTNNETLYNTPFPTKVKDIIQYVAKRYGVSESTVKSPSFSFTLEMVPDYERNSGSTRPHLTTSTFVDKYNLWVSSQFPYEKIEERFLVSFKNYVIIYAVSVVLIFMLFLYLYKIEKKQKALLEYKLINQKQEKFIVIGKTLSSIEHQWRSPLSKVSSIIMELESFLRFKGMPQKEHLQDSLTKVNFTLQYMTNLVAEFKGFYLSGKEKEYFSINESINSAINLFQYEIDKHKIAIKVISQGNHKTYGYYNEFVQILLNIFSNSKDAFLEKSIKKPTITISILTLRDCLAIEVEDNAGGFDIDNPNIVFESNYSKKESSSTGFGLYMAKEIIVHKMNGLIESYNSEKGAVIKITLKN